MDLTKNKEKKATLTKSQEKAIASTKQKIIVNSSAGTGKTTVLSHRIIHFIKKGLNITDFLALTFTNSAAREMRSRVQKLLSEEIDKATKEDQKNHLIKQLELLPTAYILTFHSFCKRMLEENFSLLNISSNIKIGLPYLIHQMTKDSIEDEFALQMKSKSNYKFLSQFYKSGVQDNFVGAIVKFLNLLSYKKDGLENLLSNNLNLYKWNNDKVPEAFLKVALESEIIRHKFLLLKGENIDEKECESNINNCIKLASSEEESDNFRILLKDFINGDKFAEMFINSFNVHDKKKHFKKVENSINWLYDFTKKVHERVVAKKVKLDILSYDDLILKFLTIIKNKEFLEGAINNKFKEVIIDEFQDTSEYQYEFVRKLTKPRLFVVGDKKQSIYRFSGARPELFEELMREALSKDNQEVINLDRNFRSQKPILSFVNDTFDFISNELESNSFLYKSGDKFEIIDDGKDDQEIRIEEHLLNDKNPHYGLEYCFIDIKKRMKNDDKLNFEDFLVLANNNLNFLETKFIARKQDVPININFQTPLNSSPLFSITYNLIKLIENELDDDALMSSLLHVFKFNENEIAKIKVEKSNANEKEIFNSFFYFLPWYTKHGADKVLKEKVISTLNSIRTISNNFANMNIKSFFSFLFNDFKLLRKCIEKDYEEEGMLWFRNMIGRIEEISSLGERTISSVLWAISNGDENLATNVEGSIISSSNAINIMTCHKSKGLEGKIVYFLSESRLRKEFILIDGIEGIHFNMEDIATNTKVTIPQKFLLEYKEKTLRLYDLLRLLYVTFTRPKERLIILSGKRKPVKGIQKIILEHNFQGLLAVLANEEFWDKHVTTIIEEDKKIKPEPPLIVNKEREVDKIINKNLLGEKQIFHRKDETIPFNDIWENEPEDGLNYGTSIHKLFENYFLSKRKNIDDKNYRVVQDFIKENNVSLWLKNSINIIPELPIIYMTQEKQVQRGRVDLLIQLKDKTIIIDYKTDSVKNEKEILERHEKQLNSYCDALKNKFKNIEAHIYSTHLKKLITVKTKNILHKSSKI